jgi:hypothetical protein
MNQTNYLQRQTGAPPLLPYRSAFLRSFPQALLALALGACADDPDPFEPPVNTSAVEQTVAGVAMPPAIEDALTRLVPEESADALRAALLELSAQIANDTADQRAVRTVKDAIDRYAATSAADALDVAALRLSVELLTSPEN